MKIAGELGESRKEADILAGMSFNLRKQRNFEHALQFTGQSLEIAERIGSKSQILMNYKDFVFLYSAINAQDSAEKYLEKYHELKNVLDVSLSDDNAESGSGMDLARSASKSGGFALKTQAWKGFQHNETLLVVMTTSIVIISGLLVFIFLLLAFLSINNRRNRYF